MGTSDPRHNKLGKIKFRLGIQLTTYTKRYPPPIRVRYLPVSFLKALDTTYQRVTDRHQAISYLAWIYFFFLLRPGEYCRGGANTDHHPFLPRYF